MPPKTPNAFGEADAVRAEGLMNAPWRLVTSASWRFGAGLAGNGLCHPPAFPGGAWSHFDRRAFRTAAACLSNVAGGSARVDKQPHDEMEVALAEVRRRLLSRDADCWPALPHHGESVGPLDFSVLVGWGAQWWFTVLIGRRDRVALRAQLAAAKVSSAVDHAVWGAGHGGGAAYLNRDLTRLVDRLQTGLSDLHPSARPIGRVGSDVACVTA